MGTYESKEKIKNALNKLEHSLLAFKKEFPLTEIPEEKKELHDDALNLYNEVSKFTGYIVNERGKYNRETKTLKKIMGE